MGYPVNIPLNNLNRSSDSMSQKITISHHQLGWRCIYLDLRPCTENYCENKSAQVWWKEMAKDQQAYFNVEDQPEGVTLEEPSHLQKQQVMALWDFWTSRQRDGQVSLIFLGCDKQ